LGRAAQLASDALELRGFAMPILNMTQPAG
jgi:hypothetical protein